MQLTNEQKRIKIAEACGWIATSDGQATGWLKGSPWVGEIARPMPNYLNDLNAMHEAEKALTSEQQEQYAGWLTVYITDEVEDDEGNLVETKTDKSELYKSLTTSATQRAEAFGKTLSLW